MGTYTCDTFNVCMCPLLQRLRLMLWFPFCLSCLSSASSQHPYETGYPSKVVTRFRQPFTVSGRVRTHAFTHGSTRVVFPCRPFRRPGPAANCCLGPLWGSQCLSQWISPGSSSGSNMSRDHQLRYSTCVGRDCLAVKWGVSSYPR